MPTRIDYLKSSRINFGFINGILVFLKIFDGLAVPIFDIYHNFLLDK